MAVVALATAVPASAANERPKIRFTTAGQAAARAAVITRADLNTPAGWTGGAVKPDLSPGPPCPGFRPKQADLVMTGAAEATFRHTSGYGFNTLAQVMQSAKMVRLDWQRTVADPRVTGCLRRAIKQEARTSKYKFISLARLAFPRLTPLTRAYRVIYDQGTGKKKTRIFLDLVSIGHGRTELLMSTSGPLIGADSVLDAEVSLGRRLVARVKQSPA